MERHILSCTKNPDNFHPCFTCKHFEIDEGFTEEWREGGGEIYSEDKPYKNFVCRASKEYKAMHTKRAELKGLPLKYPNSFIDTECMPNSCELFLSVHPTEPFTIEPEFSGHFKKFMGDLGL